MTKLITLLTHNRGLCAALVASLFCWAAASGVAASGAESQERWTRSERPHFVSIVNETSKSVVSIQGEKQYESSQKSFGRGQQYDVFNGMGTGVVIDERGYILTNYHVVKGLLKLEVITSDGEHYRDVELIRNDVATDLALLRIKPKSPLHKIRMGRTERVQLAEDVYAVGNPFGYSCSVSRGIVSSVSRPLEVNESLSYDSVIQTDAAINPGNSGGPLINVDGEMIGLNAAVREEAENIAFAIPVDVVSEVAERMIRQSVAKMTHHGLKFRVVDADMDDYPADATGEDCLVVESVDPHSPAAQAGVKPGDVLTASNGFAVHSSLDFTCSLIGLGLSDVAELSVERDGSELDATIAFSDLSGRESRLVAGAGRKNANAANDDDDSAPALAYQTSTVAVPFAEETEETPAASNRARKFSSAAAQCVWDALGVEVETADADEYRKRFPNLQAVGIGNFTFAPTGGVSVVKIDPDGLLATGDVKLQEGDFIFGFGVGEDSDGQLSVTSLENLYYIAKRLDEFSAVDSGRARVYLIRKGKPYFMEIDLEQYVE